MKKNIAIVGSRSFNDYDSMKEFILNRINLNEINKIISGGAIGADKLGERFSKEVLEQRPKVYKPNWVLYGKRAGMLRNTKIIEEADIVFVFWDGMSRGTADSIGKAKRMNKELYIYRY